MRRFMLVFSLVLLIFAVTANAAPDKVKLVVGLYSPGDAATAAWLPDFEKAYPNIDIEMKANDFFGHHNALFTAVVSGHSAPDVAAVDIFYLPLFVAHGGLCNLLKPPYNAGNIKPYFAPYKWAQASLDDGSLIGIPVDTNPGGAYYRRDIFKTAGVNIDDIKTMDDLFAAAKKMTADTDGDGKVDRWFIADAAQIATMILNSDTDQQLYFDSKGRCVVDKERIKLAFAWAQKFRQAGLDAGLTEWTAAWTNAVNKGGIVFLPAGAYMGGYLKNWIAPGTSGKWGVAKFPALRAGEKPMACGWGGAFLVIPEQSQHKAEAWTYIQYACANRDAQLAAYQYADVFPARMSAWNDPVFSEKLDFFAGQQVRLFWTEIAKEAPERITNRNDDMAAAIVGSELTAVLKDGKNVDQALKDAKARIEEAIDH